MDQQTQDQELEAIHQIMSALGPLDETARQRVLEYVSDRLDIKWSRIPARRVSSPPPTASGTDDTEPRNLPEAYVDIRSLKESKSPETAVEMAIVIAYYLSEMAPIEERKSTVNSTDLSVYFKQAKYPLPRSMKDVLPNAKKAGYIDTVAPGEYKLNSVGYNLAVHGLPHRKQS